jgi:two-component system response regulator PilR (NtrC family)
MSKLNRLKQFYKLNQEVEYLRRNMFDEEEISSFVFESEIMKNILSEIRKVAPKSSNILISGKSGSGKEVISKLIHDFSGKKDKPFIAINCAGLQENLLESELFGHVKGAYTGAVSDKAGFFEIAGEGSIFLDEISEMSLSLQSKLLRVLEQKEYYKVGDTNVQKLSARIIAATNKNLFDSVKKGEFREDLFYRISVFEIKLPPLRERKEDIIPLSNYFIKKYNKEMKTNIRGMVPEVFSAFMNYDWPGNIRELRNIIERAMIITSDELITLDDLPEELKKSDDSGEQLTFKTAVQSFEKKYILDTLNKCKWNKEKTAKFLDINPSTLYRKMAEYNIKDNH